MNKVEMNKESVGRREEGEETAHKWLHTRVRGVMTQMCI